MSEPEPVPVAWVRRRREPAPARPRRAAGWILVPGLVLAVAVALGAVAVQRTESRLRASGQEAPATVTAVVPTKSSYNVDVRFTTADGREITARLKDFPRDPGLATGDRLRVGYDPERPDATLWDVRDPLAFTGATIFLAALSAVLAAASIVTFALLRRRRG
ncbi:DUF3592 domain-containing protein [Amycolatopsis sp. NBC_01307]|uniref:DUF3592 domain-containing protein n=1 Tax=Amycolatopsis sp. NBC_01307 TaxID=2903561 RepID=UPI002E11F13C|nr:DUF3592 domain-containing protein [Amycolatopsis sp. NBC_01307]